MVCQPTLLTDNPNGINPVRLDPSNVNNVLTCDQNHDYLPEQQAADNGAEDKFPTYTAAAATGTDPEGQACSAQRGHGLLRRQCRHRGVELRAALRDERQQLRLDLRTIDRGRAQRHLG